MADNYLESRYREIFENQGSPARKGGASLDMILRKSAEQGEPDPAYKVHALQVGAIVRSIRLAFGEIECCSDGPVITIAIPDDFTAGRIAQTALLKASEMGLHAAFSLEHNMLTITIRGVLHTTRS